MTHSVDADQGIGPVGPNAAPMVAEGGGLTLCRNIPARSMNGTLLKNKDVAPTCNACYKLDPRFADERVE